MKTIGHTDRHWSLSQAIHDQIEKESWQEWAQKPVATLKYDYRPLKLQLTEAAKEALGKGIYYVNLLRKI